MSEQIVQALAGAGGGVISMAATYPLITIGTRLQVQQRQQQQHSASSLIDTAEHIYHTKGLSGFYNGLSTAMLAIGFTNGVYYYAYESFTQLALSATSSRRFMTAMESLGVGSAAGVVTVVVTNPIWVLSTRMAAGETTSPSPQMPRKSTSESDHQTSAGIGNVEKSTNAISMMMHIIQREGLSSLWKGVMPALILVSNPAIQYAVFEQLKARMLRRRGSTLSNADNFLLGAVSKLVATFLTYPVIKARMQVQKSDNKKSYKSTMQAMRTILREEGLSGLYSGLASKLLQSVLTAAILFWAKEILVGWSRHLLVLLLRKQIPSTNSR